jgi:hypothetical protein
MMLHNSAARGAHWIGQAADVLGVGLQQTCRNTPELYKACCECCIVLQCLAICVSCIPFHRPSSLINLQPVSSVYVLVGLTAGGWFVSNVCNQTEACCLLRCRAALKLAHNWGDGAYTI